MTNAYHPDKAINRKVTALLQDMSLEEKVNQISCRLFIGGMGTAAEKKINCGTGEIGFIGSGQNLAEFAEFVHETQAYVMEHSPHRIPALFHCEGVQGIVLSGTTQYSSALAQGAGFDPQTVHQMADEIRKDMLALGLRQVLSPLFDVARDFRWGRINETYGGDPTLVAQMGCAYTKGIQGPSLDQGIAATAKHFLGYAYTEGGLNMSKVLADERELREIFALPFEAAIHQAGIASVMNAYSEINGRPVAANRAILTDLLRKELGFDGVVVSDYSSLVKLITRFRIASTPQEAGIMALTAGIDVELPAPYGFVDTMIEAVRENKISEAFVDRAAGRILHLKFQLGLFDHPFPDLGKVRKGLRTASNEATALKMARNAMTLTKNEGLLPLKNTDIKIAVIGPSGNSIRHMYGSYTNVANKEMLLGQVIAMEGVSDTMKVDERFRALTGIRISNASALSEEKNATSALSLRFEDNDAVNQWLSENYPGVQSIYQALQQRFPHISFVEGCHTHKTEENAIEEAVQSAQKADVVVLCLGGKNGWGLHCTSGEGVDRSDAGLSGLQELLMRRVYEANPNIVLVHNDCVPLISSFAYEYIPAILETWLPGGYGGQAIAETLTGETNPGGRLPFDVPASSGVGPIFHYQHNGNGMGQLLPDVINPQGYMDISAFPVRPFGYGLSYTQFAYSDMAFSCDAQSIEQIQVCVTVTNTGNQAGDDVVFLFGRDVKASMIRPRQELIGFQRISLKPGERKRVTFRFSLDRMAMMDEEKKWVIEKGVFDFFLGNHAANSFYEVSYEKPETVEIVPNERCLFAHSEATDA